MLISEFDYQLPGELIAQEPLEKRDTSRMLVVDRAAGTIRDDAFSDIGRFLGPGDLLVVNNTKVFPGRLAGNSDTGASVEIFLVRPDGVSTWEALAKPARRVRPGKSVFLS